VWNARAVGLALTSLALLPAAYGFSPLSSVRSVHEELPDNCAASMAARVAGMAPKVVRKVIPAPRPHWGESLGEEKGPWRAPLCARNRGRRREA
jgi:hypothetical protein